MRVDHAQAEELRHHGELAGQLEAGGVGAGDVEVAAEGLIDAAARARGEVDEVLVAVVEGGRRQRDGAVEEGLVDAGIDADRALGLRATPCRRPGCRAGTGTAPCRRYRRWTSASSRSPGFRKPPSRARWRSDRRSIDVVDAPAERQMQPLAERDLVQGEGRAGGLLGRRSSARAASRTAPRSRRSCPPSRARRAPRK